MASGEELELRLLAGGVGARSRYNVTVDCGNGSLVVGETLAMTVALGHGPEDRPQDIQLELTSPDGIELSGEPAVDMGDDGSAVWLKLSNTSHTGPKIRLSAVVIHGDFNLELGRSDPEDISTRTPPIRFGAVRATPDMIGPGESVRLELDMETAADERVKGNLTMSLRSSDGSFPPALQPSAEKLSVKGKRTMSLTLNVPRRGVEMGRCDLVVRFRGREDDCAAHFDGVFAIANRLSLDIREASLNPADFLPRSTVMLELTVENTGREDFSGTVRGLLLSDGFEITGSDVADWELPRGETSDLALNMTIPTGWEGGETVVRLMWDHRDEQGGSSDRSLGYFRVQRPLSIGQITAEPSIAGPGDEVEIRCQLECPGSKNDGTVHVSMVSISKKHQQPIDMSGEFPVVDGGAVALFSWKVPQTVDAGDIGLDISARLGDHSETSSQKSVLAVKKGVALRILLVNDPGGDEPHLPYLRDGEEVLERTQSGDLEVFTLNSPHWLYSMEGRVVGGLEGVKTSDDTFRDRLLGHLLAHRVFSEKETVSLANFLNREATYASSLSIQSLQLLDTDAKDTDKRDRWVRRSLLSGKGPVYDLISGSDVPEPFRSWYRHCFLVLNKKKGDPGDLESAREQMRSGLKRSMDPDTFYRFEEVERGVLSYARAMSTKSSGMSDPRQELIHTAVSGCLVAGCDLLAQDMIKGPGGLVGMGRKDYSRFVTLRILRSLSWMMLAHGKLVSDPRFDRDLARSFMDHQRKVANSVLSEAKTLTRMFHHRARTYRHNMRRRRSRARLYRGLVSESAGEGRGVPGGEGTVQLRWKYSGGKRENVDLFVMLPTSEWGLQEPESILSDEGNVIRGFDLETGKGGLELKLALPPNAYQDAYTVLVVPEPSDRRFHSEEVM